ncbi:MAG TPA: hypothetical protein VF904_19535 [Anaeromyxobacteraceae bacterium]
MAKMRRLDSKAALAQQRADTRRGARGKAHIGDDTGSAAARAAERAKVRRMQEVQHARGEVERLRQPLSVLLVDIVADAVRLTRTVVTIPLRMALALRGHRPAVSER